MGRINDLARFDFARITEGIDWGVDLIIYPPSLDPVSVKGLTTDHTALYDPDDGTKSLERSIHINVIESTLNALGVVTRDANNNVDLNNWKVEVLEATGIVKTIVREAHPDKKIDCIRMILELADYE